MHPLSPETQAQLQSHLDAVAEILYRHTEADKLNDFESIEWELREQILTQVAPHLGEFFSQAASTSRVEHAQSKAALAKSPSANDKVNA